MTDSIELLDNMEIDGELPFHELHNNLLVAMQEENKAAAIAQLFFSSILIGEKWKEARIWICPETGSLYSSPYEAPDDEDIVETDTLRYRSVDDWIAEVEALPGFARSTCYQRHKLIVGQMTKLGRSLKDAWKSVMLSSYHSELMLSLVTDEKGNLNPDRVVNLLPEPMREEAKDRVRVEGNRAMQDIVIDRMEQDEVRLAEGEHARTVNRDLRDQLTEGASYKIALAENHPGAFIVKRELEGEDSFYLIHIRDERDVTRAIPRDVFEWVAGRLRVRLSLPD